MFIDKTVKPIDPNDPGDRYHNGGRAVTVTFPV